ncbi:YbiU family protein [Shigella flexneri]
MRSGCLNRLWTFESDGKQWFNPDVERHLPDRIRRRPPERPEGLGAHTDSGALERWLLPAYQRVLANVFNGNLAQCDPWHAAHRTEVEEYTVDNTTRMFVFSDIQAGTALSDMLPRQGCCTSYPFLKPSRTLYIPLLDDVPEDELCGVAPEGLAVSEQWHPLLIEALTSIPKLEARDSVLVALRRHPFRCPVENQQGWGDVDVHPTAPMCEKNLAYAHKVKAALEKGASPGDFRARTMKQTGKDATLPTSTLAGKRALGMDV